MSMVVLHVVQSTEVEQQGSKLLVSAGMALRTVGIRLWQFQRNSLKVNYLDTC